jgi:hypothetical protein
LPATLRCVGCIGMREGNNRSVKNGSRQPSDPSFKPGGIRGVH